MTAFSRPGMIVVSTILAAGMLVTGVLVTLATPTTAAPLIPATVTPEPPFILTFTPETRQLRAGEILTIMADVAVRPGCQFPVFELALNQTVGEKQIFSHIEPPVDMITGPIPMPFAWTFRADEPGTATFSGHALGERYCGDYWLFIYLDGISGRVTVRGPTVTVLLPTIAR